ncbi:MAG: hypothetical protein SFY92_11240 [Verrucomicrobiae bacterium]|nr:hypothetical protein [Verrucomicrobiae bacterium]
MSSSHHPETDGFRHAPVYAVVLLMFVVWSVVIKYINPLCWSWAQYRLTGHFPAPPIMLDLWPVAHLWLAAWFWTRHRLAWPLGLAVSGIEIVVILVKFAGFYMDPAQARTTAPADFDFFMTQNWFVNKLALLALFVVMFLDLLTPRLRTELGMSTLAKKVSGEIT